MANLEIAGALKRTQKGAADWYYGGDNEAWPNLATAKANIPASIRPGKTIGVFSSGTITEYWWPTESVADGDIVVKGGDVKPDLSGDEANAAPSVHAVNAALSTVIALTPEATAGIGVGEKVLVSLQKLVGGSVVLDATTKQLDTFAGVTIETLLQDNQPWGNISGQGFDYIQLTGDNTEASGKLLGEEGQIYQIGGNFYICQADDDTSSTWVRNWSTDCLNASIATDAAIIAALEDETGWNSDGSKTITIRSRPGRWWMTNTGYAYFCYGLAGSAWNWRRLYNTPNYSAMEITIGDHPNLVANLRAHDFTSGFYSENTAGGDESAEQGQKYIDEDNNKAYERNQNGKWFKITA
jgi:hypothetical protein